MGGNDIFVGRQRELGRFQEVLADPAGQAVVVVGAAGMGKTWLVNKMAEAAKEHPTLRCGVVRYELVSRDSVDIVMERMMDDAFRAGEVVEGSFDATAHRRKQWYALLETVVPKGDKVAKLMQSFQRDVKRPVREEFVDRLRLISRKMGENGRGIFVIDPWECLAKDCAEDWAIVIRELPEKVKFVFAQRPEDAIAKYRKFMGLKNVIGIPGKALGGLDEKAVDEFLDIRAGETKYTIVTLRDGLRRFGRHPYALQGAINLLAEGREIDTLPDDPTETGVIEQQWEEICACGEEAIRLFKAFAILWVSVPDDVVERVAEVGSDRRLALLASSGFLGRLIGRDEDSGRLYHVLLAEYIGNRMSGEEKRGYHERAAAVYRAKLKAAKESQSRPDELSAVRLSEHVRAAEGVEAFVEAFVNECCRPLINLGCLEVCVGLSREALEAVQKGSENRKGDRGDIRLQQDTHRQQNQASVSGTYNFSSGSRQ